MRVGGRGRCSLRGPRVQPGSVSDSPARPWAGRVGAGVNPDVVVVVAVQGNGRQLPLRADAVDPELGDRPGPGADDLLGLWGWRPGTAERSSPARRSASIPKASSAAYPCARSPDTSQWRGRDSRWATSASMTWPWVRGATRAGGAQLLEDSGEVPDAETGGGRQGTETSLDHGRDHAVHVRTTHLERHGTRHSSHTAPRNHVHLRTSVEASIHHNEACAKGGNIRFSAR